MRKTFLTLTDVARELGVHRSRVRAWVDTGDLPHVWMGKVRRIPRGAFEQWLREKEQEALRAVKR